MAESEIDALRTQVANAAASLAESVTAGFEGFHMGAGDYIVELMAPEVQSTRGGAQGRQSIRLVPRRKGFSALVVGSVDPVTRSADVRTFQHVALLHEQRFKRPIEITLEEYAGFLGKLELVLKLAGVRHRYVGPPFELLGVRPSARIPLPFAVMIVVAVALAALVVYRLLGLW
jgi:hypothetical protein